MPKDTAGKNKTGKIRDRRQHVEPPVVVPSAKPKGPRGNQAPVVTPLPASPSTQKRPRSSQDEGPTRKKTKHAQAGSDSVGTRPNSVRQRHLGALPSDPGALGARQPSPPPSILPPSIPTSRRARDGQHPLSSRPPPSSDPVSSSLPPSSSTSITSTLQTQEMFAATIRRMRAAPQAQMDDGEELLTDEDAPRKKGKRIQLSAQAEEEGEDVAEEEEDAEDAADTGNEVDTEDESEDEHADEEVSASDARRFLKAIRKSKKKNKYHVSPTDADPKLLTEHFKTWGRHCHRLCGLYTDVHKTIVTGMTVMRAAPHDADDYELCYKSIPHMSPATAKFYTSKFFHLCDHIPKFTALCEQILSSPENVFLFAKYMQVHAAAGRTTDISTLKTSYHSYFPYVIIAGGDVIPPPGPGTLSDLKTRNGGYCSTSTGRLVVPIDELAQFDLDPSKFCKQKISQNRKIQGASSAMRHKKRHQADRLRTRDDNMSYPSFLFPTDIKYDNTHPDRHIFKGNLLLSGPSAVGRSGGLRGFGRAPLVEIYSITKVTPDYIVYVASLLRYLLSTDDRWNGDDRQRSGHCFHTALHRLLTIEYEAWQDDSEDEYVEPSEDPLDWNVFAFYNDKVFGNEAGAPDQQDPAADVYEEDCNDADNVRAQVLKARMAELLARRAQRATRLRGASPQRDDTRSRSSSAELVDTNTHFIDITEDASPPAEDPSEHDTADDAQIQT
ncbi:hypothetical protein BD311DRAFT_811292 [Dichomitus squalens]|uniref:Uncharacterized protein n=1 Tax=Dichomitus squalens TaxID=114155 RepID=A0A4Q9M6V2_9APHY|nr:hypothetical protein BD311DRAFT_811292 [Dichomitus squalens]